MEFNATFTITAISFIIFTFIMNAIFYKPLENIVAKRKKYIDDSYEEAKSNEKKASGILKDKTRKIDQTKQDAKKIILEKSDSAKETKAQMTTDAQGKTNSLIENAKNELVKASEEAKGAFSEETHKLADIITHKVLG